MPGIIAFFNALPAFIQLLSQLGSVIQRLMQVAETNNINKWIADLEKSIDAIENAKNPEEKLNGAKGLVDVIHRLGDHRK